MSFFSRLGSGLAVSAAIVASAGCFNNELTSFDEEPSARFDKGALDMYMVDMSRPSIEVTVSGATTYKGFHGDWEAKLDMDSEAMKAEMEKERAERMKDPNYDPASEEFAAAFAEGMAEMFSMSLSIKEDKTFMMTMMFFPVEGRWEQKGDQLWLHADKVMGMSKEDLAKMGGTDMKMESDMDEPMKLKISADGTTLTAIDSKKSFGSDELVFRRKAVG